MIFEFELNDPVDVQFENFNGEYFPGRISKVNEGDETKSFDIAYRDGDFEACVPGDRIIKYYPLKDSDVNVGDFVEVRWPDEKGQFYPGRISMIDAANFGTGYGVNYYDGGTEGPVPLNRIRKIDTIEKRFNFDPTNSKVVHSFKTDEKTWDKYLNYKKSKARLKGATNTPLNGAPNTCWLCCVPPWTIHYIVFSPCIWCPCLTTSLLCPSCYGYEKMELPKNADNIIDVTTEGIVGNVVSIGRKNTSNKWQDSYISHFMGPQESPRGSISWDNFDIKSVKIRREGDEHLHAGTCYSPCCGSKHDMNTLTQNTDGITVGIGLCSPCGALVCCNPKLDDVVYSTEITSKDGMIVLSAPALNVSPEELINKLQEYYNKYH